MNSPLPKISQGYFFERKKPPRNSEISVLSARYNIRTYHAEVKTIAHPFWVLDYSHGNCGLCRVGKRSNPWFARQSGRMHLYRPNTKYWEDTSSAPIPVRSSFITFYGGDELDLSKHVNIGDGYCSFMDKSGKAGGLFLEAASEAAHGGANSYWSAMSKLYAVIDLIQSAQAIESAMGDEKIIADPENGDCRSREYIFVDAVRKYLQEHIEKNVGITDLAAHMNASISTISHKYRELTGETPMQALTTFRINAVKSLLAKGDPIKFIASQTGFYDEFHLSKVFKKATGTSPSAYLKHPPLR